VQSGELPLPGKAVVGVRRLRSDTRSRRTRGVNLELGLSGGELRFENARRLDGVIAFDQSRGHEQARDKRQHAP
jgi:hypothetical protein